MKTLIKPKYLILLSWVLGCILFSVPAHASSDYQLEGKIKAPSMKKVMTESLKIAQEAGVPNQKLVVSFIFLSLLGHPNYSYVEPNHNVCAFIYFSPKEGRRKYVIMAKLKDASTFRRVVDGVGWSMTDFAGWSFFTKKKEDAPSKKDMASLIDYAKVPTANDLELEFTSYGRPFFYKDHLSDLDKLAANIDRSLWNFNISEDKILMNSLLKYRSKKGASLNDWLQGALSDATVKDIPAKGTDHSNVEVTIVRKQLNGLAGKFQQQPEKR